MKLEHLIVCIDLVESEFAKDLPEEKLFELWRLHNKLTTLQAIEIKRIKELWPSR